jgi:hypothetical protein
MNILNINILTLNQGGHFMDPLCGHNVITKEVFSESFKKLSKTDIAIGCVAIAAIVATGILLSVFVSPIAGVAFVGACALAAVSKVAYDSFKPAAPAPQTQPEAPKTTQEFDGFGFGELSSDEQFLVEYNKELSGDEENPSKEIKSRRSAQAILDSLPKQPTREGPRRSAQAILDSSLKQPTREEWLARNAGRFPAPNPAPTVTRKDREEFLMHSKKLRQEVEEDQQMTKILLEDIKKGDEEFEAKKQALQTKIGDLSLSEAEDKWLKENAEFVRAPNPAPTISIAEFLKQQEEMRVKENAGFETAPNPAPTISISEFLKEQEEMRKKEDAEFETAPNPNSTPTPTKEESLLQGLSRTGKRIHELNTELSRIQVLSGQLDDVFKNADKELEAQMQEPARMPRYIASNFTWDD